MNIILKKCFKQYFIGRIEAFFEKHIDKIDWVCLPYNNFNSHFNRISNSLTKYCHLNSLIEFQFKFKEWLYSPRNPNLNTYLKQLWTAECM